MFNKFKNTTQYKLILPQIYPKAFPTSRMKEAIKVFLNCFCKQPSCMIQIVNKDNAVCKTGNNRTLRCTKNLKVFTYTGKKCGLLMFLRHSPKQRALDYL